MNKLKTLILLLILTAAILPPIAEAVTVKRQIPTKPQEPIEQPKEQSLKPEQPQLTSAQKLNKIKKYARNYAKKQLTLKDDEFGYDYCEMKFTLEGLGAENIYLTMFDPKYVYKDKVETGFKFNGVIYRHVKRCVKLEFEFENKSYYTGFCK